MAAPTSAGDQARPLPFHAHPRGGSAASAARYLRPLRRRVPIVLILTLSCDWLYCGDRPEVDIASTVKALDVIPPTVFVTPGAVFVMRARMLDQEKGALPKHEQLTWTLGPGLTEQDRGGDSIVLKAGTVTPGTSVNTSLSAQLEAMNASATIVILATNAVETLDSVRGDYRAGAFPDVALVDDTLASTPVNDSLIAYVQIGLLGDLIGGTGEVARLSADQSFHLRSVTWRAAIKDLVDLRSASGTPNALLQPSFTVWIATSAAGGVGIAQDDVAHASAVFRRQLTGLGLRPTIRPATSVGVYVLELGPNGECLQVAPKLQDLGVPSTAVAPESLNVMYVDDILSPPSGGEVGVSAVLAGYRCPSDPNAGAVIFISRRWRSGGTLTHELGHALGLGHTGSPGLQLHESNVAVRNRRGKSSPLFVHARPSVSHQRRRRLLVALGHRDVASVFGPGLPPSRKGRRPSSMSVHRPISAVALAIFALWANACRLSPREYAIIDAWLLCDDCQSGERAAVKAIGGKAVHTLNQALVGPSPGRVANKEAQFRQMHGTLDSPTVSESAYVTELRSNYVARYQSRAAISLGDIGGSRALRALRRARDAAATRGYRADVVGVIQAVLTLSESDAFTGRVTPKTPRFGDTVRVARGGGLAWDGDEAVVLHGSPFADSLVVFRWLFDSLAFVAVGSLGDYALSVTRLGPQAVTQVSPLQIVPPSYTSHTPTTAPLVTADSFPQTRYMLLPSRVSDSTDYFRFEPAASLTATASLTSAGRESPGLQWFRCAPFSLVPVAGPVTVVRGYVVDGAGTPVDNANVSITGTSSAALTAGGGRFSIGGVPASPGVVEVRAFKTGYMVSTTRVQLGAESVQIPLLSAGTTDATARSWSASTVTIPAGACRLLQVMVPSGGGARIIRLRLRSS
jgi:hypothetical protein